MFEKSQMYVRLEKVRAEVTQLLCECFITEFINHLYAFYLRGNDDPKITFLVWLGQQEGYGELVGGRRSKFASYDLLGQADQIFDDRDAFKDALEYELNNRYGEENAAKLLVRIDENDPESNGLPELITFVYDETWAWGD
jgi:hypothetical protein